MRIVIYARPYLPSVGGLQLSAALMREQLVAMGHEVIVLTETPPGTVGIADEEDGIVRQPSLTRFWRNIAKGDLLIIRGALSLQAAIPAILAGTSFVTFHEMAGPFAGHDRSASGWIKAGLRRLCAAKSRLHVGVSQSVLATLDLPPRSPTTVLYNPVHPVHEEAPRLPLAARDTDILYVGRLIESKGVLQLPAAVAEASGRIRRPLRVTVAGGGPDLDRLRAITNRDCVNEWDFVGTLDQRDLATHYARSRLLAVPSTTHLEGMCMVAAESMMHGTPVVYSPQAPIAEVVGDAGFSASPEDPRKFGAAMVRILDDAAIWQQCSDVAQDRRAHFSGSAYRKSLETLVSRALRD